MCIHIYVYEYTYIYIHIYVLYLYISEYCPVRVSVTQTSNQDIPKKGMASAYRYVGVSSVWYILAIEALDA